MEIVYMLVCCLVVGFAIGGTVVGCILRAYSCGNLIITDDPEAGVYMFLQIAKYDENYIRRKPYIKLRVVDKGTH